MSADSDFADRRSAPGVVFWNAFDNAGDIAGLIDTATDGTTQGTIDSTAGNFCSGTGSLRFKLRAGIADKNIGGAFEAPIGHSFTSGDTIYIQFREKITPEYKTNNLGYWHSSIKHFNCHGVSSTCQGAEYTMTTQPITPGTDHFINLYTNCGDGFNTDPVTNVLCSSCPNGGPMIQQGTDSTHGYNCDYTNQTAGAGDGPGCFFPPSNEWVTYYVKIVLGTYNGNSSTIDAYVARSDGPYKQFQRAAGIEWAGGDTTFAQIRMETYMTEIAGPAPVDAYVWYDELIISTLPIAAPNSGSSSGGGSSGGSIMVPRSSMKTWHHAR